MKFEYLELYIGNIKKIAALDLSNLDKLFLQIKIINNNWLELPLTQLHYLKKMDTSKIVLLKRPQFENEVYCEQYIPIKEWTGRIITNNSNYLLNNYNFINVPRNSIHPRCLIDGKINIVLLSHNAALKAINDTLRLLDCVYIDIVVEPKLFRSGRILYSVDGIFEIRCHEYTENFQHIQLIDEKVYIKPAV